MNKKFSTLLCASLLFSSAFSAVNAAGLNNAAVGANATAVAKLDKAALSGVYQLRVGTQDRKSTRLNSSHLRISHAVFCLKKKRINIIISKIGRAITHLDFEKIEGSCSS